MPTISQLPVAPAVTASDSVPISQGGVAKSVAVGTLLAQTQPVIMLATGTLLGRVSVGTGAPEQIDTGTGLTLNAGTIAANGGDHALFTVEPSLQLSDHFVISSSGTPMLVEATALRSIFSPGSNIAIDASGVISATVAVVNEGTTSATFAISQLPTTTVITSPDLLAVSQSGVENSISYANLLNGQTIGAAQAAGAASSTDTFWCSQDGETLVRQSLADLWVWVAGNVASVLRPVSELSANVTLNAGTHNGHVLVCSQPVTLSIVPASLGSGFWCEVINVSTGNATLSGTITTSSGQSFVAPGQTALLRCVTYSRGTIAYATISGAVATVVVPGAAGALASTAIGTTSIGITWQAPTSGGAASGYTVQFRISGASSWTQAAAGLAANAYTITGLTASVSYDFTVVATNSAGSGPLSAVLTVSTAATLAPPGQPSTVSATVASSTSVSVGWQAPSSSGPVVSYTLQYRVTGTTGWTSSMTGVTATAQTVSGLTASTSYDFSVFAVNAAGSGTVSSTVTAVTAAATGSVTSITWNVPPSGSYSVGSGAIGVNAHVTPSTAAVQFGFSQSSTVAPTSWTAGSFVNTNLWGAYVPTPSTAGSWYAWVEGTDGSSPTVYQTAFTVS